MNWRNIRDEAKRIVHETFAFPAKYYANSTGVGVAQDVTARLHTNTVFMGDLDREGYPRTAEGVERVILLKTDMDRCGISERSGTLRIEGFDALFYLELQLPKTDEVTRTFEVKQV